MKRGPCGKTTRTSTLGETVDAFVPAPLPPEPPLQLEGDLGEQMDQALLALGRLDTISTLLPDASLFLYSYVRKEAVLSSQIEGTQSSLSDLLLFELEEVPGSPVDDVVDVSSYVAALEHGLKRVRDGFPVSGRLLREIHGVLLSRGRGSNKRPGEFRTSQNWIGGTRPGNAQFVPPPSQAVPDCMAALELFLNDEPARTSPLIKAALAHVQFETIHPFLDGNGRVGRLLIALVLCVENVLREPLLYLSLFFKRHRSEYYRLLDVVRREGDWEAWISFFAEAVRTTSESAVDTARNLSDMFRVDTERVSGVGRSANSTLRVLQALQQRPVATAAWLSKTTGLSAPTVGKCLSRMVDLDILMETTGRRRNRVFAYKRYLALLNEGTESE